MIDSKNLKEKIAIGAVQFGLNYGISNDSGITELSEVKDIIDFAENNKIDTIDTAYSYGKSESVLGKLNLEGKKIISKFPNLKDNNKLDFYFKTSVDRMKISELYGYIAHNADVLLNDVSIWEDLNKLKSKGLINKIGYSIYKPEELDNLLYKGMFPDLIQIPYNIIDNRFDGYLKELKSKNVEIHTRSTFLQGLFFMNPNDLSEFFNEIKPFLVEFQNTYTSNADRAGFLLKHCLKNEYIDKVVIGINNHKQLDENINQIKKEFDKDINCPRISEKILLPYNWKK